MEIRAVTYQEVVESFNSLKPELIDEYATYYGAIINGELVGIVSYVEHANAIHLCHAFIKEEYRKIGIYKLLWDYRDSKIHDTGKIIYAHCNVDSLKYFLNNGYKIEKALFKVVKI